MRLDTTRWRQARFRPRLLRKPCFRESAGERSRRNVSCKPRLLREQFCRRRTDTQRRRASFRSHLLRKQRYRKRAGTRCLRGEQVYSLVRYVSVASARARASFCPPDRVPSELLRQPLCP